MTSFLNHPTDSESRSIRDEILYHWLHYNDSTFGSLIDEIRRMAKRHRGQASQKKKRNTMWLRLDAGKLDNYHEKGDRKVEGAKRTPNI